MNENIENTDIESDLEVIVEETISPNTYRSGKAVFALRSHVIIDEKIIPDGYLLFKAPDNALELIRMCLKNLEESKDLTKKKHFTNKILSYYTPHQWININEFFAGQVSTKGTFFVRNLENCCLNIIQDDSLNEDKTHSIFHLENEILSRNQLA